MIFLSVFSSCKRKCSSYHDKQPAYHVTKYINKYVPGGYYIFLNQDSTKVDSMFLTAFDTIGQTSNELCTQYQNTSFILNSQYLSADKKVTISILNDGCCNTVFGGASATGDRSWALTAKANVDSFYASSGIVLPKIMFYELWNNPAYTLVEVTPYKSTGQGIIYFTPLAGIVKYVTNDGRDSFTLVKLFTP
jgi:hypothetical protein